jgi:hypothetical protein
MATGAVAGVLPVTLTGPAAIGPPAFVVVVVIVTVTRYTLLLTIICPHCRPPVPLPPPPGMGLEPPGAGTPNPVRGIVLVVVVPVVVGAPTAGRGIVPVRVVGSAPVGAGNARLVPVAGVGNPPWPRH